MPAKPRAAAPTGRKKIAQGQERSDDALGHESQNTASTDGAKDGGSLPVGWLLQTVGELAAKEPNSITDGPFGSKLKTEHYTRSGPRVIRLTNIGDGEFVDAHAHISDDHFSTLKKHRIFSGDIVIAALGEKLPRACLIPEAVGAAIVKADCIRFRPSEEHSPKFLNYALNWEGTQKRTSSIVHGVGRPRLNLSEIKSILLPIAPLAEQRRIVGEIEKQFTRLEAGVAALQRVRANLKRYRAAVLKAACEGRLVPTEAELQKSESRKRKAEGSMRKADARYETGAELLARILTERRQNWQGRGQYKEPAEPDTAGLPALPDGWCYASAEQVCSTVASGSTPAAPKMFSGSGEVPFLKVYNLTHNGALNFSVKPTFVKRQTHEGPLARSRVFPHDVLMNIVGPPLGKVSFVPDTFPEWNINQAIVVFRPTQAIQNRLLAYWLLSDHVLGRLERTAKATAGQFNLQVTACRKLALPLPPLAEQARIVAEVERRLSVVEELEAVVSANLQRATRLRQSILQKAFTGELVRRGGEDG